MTKKALITGITGQDGAYLAVDPHYRPTEVETLLRDPSKAKLKLGWTLKISFAELAAEMVREDLKATERDELVKKHGYKAMDYHEYPMPLHAKIYVAGQRGRAGCALRRKLPETGCPRFIMGNDSSPQRALDS